MSPTPTMAPANLNRAISDRMRQALNSYCQWHHLDPALVIRQAIADRIGYDLRTDPPVPTHAQASPTRTRKPTQATSGKRPSATTSTTMATIEKRLLDQLRGNERDRIMSQLDTILDGIR